MPVQGGRARSDLHVPTMSVKVNGADLDPKHEGIIKELKVVDAMRIPDVCTITALYASNGNSDEIQIDEMPYAIGAELEVSMGAASENASEAETIFRGEIVTLEPTFTGGGAEVVVKAYDKAHRLHRNRHQKAFQDQTIGDMIDRICSDSGLSLEKRVAASLATHDYMLQSNETDWDFIWRMCDRAGLLFLVSGSEAILTDVQSEPPVAEFTLGDGALLSFRPRVTATQQVETVTVRGWDSKRQQAIVGTSKSPSPATETQFERSKAQEAFGASGIQVSTETVANEGEAKEVANALQNRLSNDHVTVEGSCRGNPSVKAGTRIKVEGAGKFSGTYFISTSTHVIRGGGMYVTQFQHMGTERTLNGLLGGGGTAHKRDFGNHLVIGVVSNNNDPDKEGRVRVKFPTLSAAEESYWCRVATYSSGDGRGVLMTPQPDEEVIVGFEHGDTRRGFVLGSLFNGKHKPSEKIAVLDGSLGMVSNKDIQMEAVEKLVLKSKTMETLTTENTKMEVKKDLEVKVDGKTNVKTTGEQTIESTGKSTYKSAAAMDLIASAPIKIKGDATIEMAAGATLTLKGQAQVKIESPMVQIQGSGMVQISGGIVKLG